VRKTLCFSCTQQPALPPCHANALAQQAKLCYVRLSAPVLVVHVLVLLVGGWVGESCIVRAMGCWISFLGWISYFSCFCLHQWRYWRALPVLVIQSYSRLDH
jgi:hypothetical protein